MSVLHGGIAGATLLYGSLLVAWGLVGALRGRASDSLVVAVCFCEALVLGAALTGLAVDGEVEPLHLVYAAVAVVLLPVALAVTRAASARTRPLTLAVAAGLLVLATARTASATA